MKQRVIVKVQNEGVPVTEEIIIEDGSFDLYEDWYAYINGDKTGPHGNSVNGAIIGNMAYYRFPDVISIKVENIEEGE